MTTNTLELRYPLFRLDYAQYYALVNDLGQSEIVPYMEYWITKFISQVKLVYPEDSGLSEYDLTEIICKDLTTYVDIYGI